MTTLTAAANHPRDLLIFLDPYVTVYVAVECAAGDGAVDVSREASC